MSELLHSGLSQAPRHPRRVVELPPLVLTPDPALLLALSGGGVLSARLVIYPRTAGEASVLGVLPTPPFWVVRPEVDVGPQELPVRLEEDLGALPLGQVALILDVLTPTLVQRLRRLPDKVALVVTLREAQAVVAPLAVQWFALAGHERESDAA